jgi:glycosyltransferase involved in cell wall biosynthesis
MKISILHPSRSRPAIANQVCRLWMSQCSKEHEIEYILSIDEDDPKLEGYRWAELLGTVVVNKNKNIVMAVNHAATFAKGDILIVVSDDFECFPGWGDVIVKALEGRSGILKTYDGVQPWIVTLPIMTMDYYKTQGYFYDPAIKHMFCDTIMTHKADLQKKLIIRNDIVFKHNHYSTGVVAKDAINIKADSTWGQGEAVYRQRCKEKFGLGRHINIYDLSPEAKIAGHIRWMKRKGIRP